MSGGQKSLLMWAAIIMFVAYELDINVAHLIGSILGAVQQVHNSNVHP